jgi:SAM-dependent methyltransferase
MNSNLDPRVIEDFGRQWSAYDQSHLPVDTATWNLYFSIFPWHVLPSNAKGFDCGAGHGRFGIPLAPRVAELHCIEPSEAIEVAKKNLERFNNVYFHKATSSNMPFADGSMDFGISLGVLHHIPDTAGGIKDCVRKLKSGAPFLVYLYYDLENRPVWYRLTWRFVDALRRVICVLPFPLKNAVCTLIAALVYWPLGRLGRFIPWKHWPLRQGADKPLYILRVNCLDRFGTKIEHRFTRAQIDKMMREAGCSSVTFKDGYPYWVCVGIKD